MSRRGGIVAGVLVCVLGVVWFLLAFERVSESETIPPSAEAQRHPYLAAERLLAHFGADVRRLQGIETAHDLSTDAVMLLPARRGVVSAGAITRLQDFVHGGGHLLVEAEAPDRVDALLEHFGIERLALGDGAVGYEGEWYSAPWFVQPTRFTPGWTWQVPVAHDRVLRIRLGSRHALRAPRTLWSVGDGDGARALSIAHGQGRVTAVTDLGLFGNTRIGSHDHAEWLYHVLDLDTPPSQFVVIQRGHRGLLHWLADAGWRALLVAALLIAVALWRAAPRFGPIAADPSPVRRSLLDHLVASGRLLWSQGERAALARAAVDAARARLRREYPHTVLMSPDALHGFLCRRFHLQPAEAQAVLAPQPPTQPLAFVFLVRACRRLHLGLSRARSGGDALYVG